MDILQILSNTLAQILSPTTIGFVLAAIGLAVHFGFTGLLNMGVAGFMAVGAYGFAISILTFGLPWWLAALIGIGAAVVFALILGIPTLRLRGDYLSIVTIAAAEVVRLLFLTTAFKDVTGSADGLSGFHTGFRASNPLPQFSGNAGFGPWSYSRDQWWVIIIGVAVVIVTVLFVWALMRSPWGRVIKGIREDEDAVRALGKNVFSFKMQALVVGGVIIALGGIVTAMGTNVNPNVYVTSQTFYIWTALLLGGAATIFGPVLGAVLFWVVRAFLSNLLPALVNIGALPFLSGEQAQMLVFVLIGIALMLLVIFRPQGILGNRKELTFVK
ncbi:MAG: branched-chain amino acid ABC transporter permease [Microbacteriaceae bacterium]|nr:branched-chain amino acid ABC transporter permease [Microbacteriaceae bacterium]